MCDIPNRNSTSRLHDEQASILPGISYGWQNPWPLDILQNYREKPRTRDNFFAGSNWIKSWRIENLDLLPELHPLRPYLFLSMVKRITLSLSSRPTKVKNLVLVLFPFIADKNFLPSYSLSLFGFTLALFKFDATICLSATSLSGKIFPFRQRKRYGTEPAMAGLGSGRLTSLLRVCPTGLGAFASNPFTFFTFTSTAC